jgi:Ca2+-transporting ATPase
MPDDVTVAVEDPHAVAAEEVASTVDVDPATGLSGDAVGQRRERYGRNTLGEESGTPWWRLVWDQIANAVVVLLIGAAVAGFVVGEVIEPAAIVVVLVVNTIVGFVTELQAARSVASLRDMMRSVADVERGDRRDEIDATDLVPVTS